MNAKTIFNLEGTDCGLEILYPDGHRHYILFERVSQMVNYCKENNIDATVSES